MYAFLQDEITQQTCLAQIRHRALVALVKPVFTFSSPYFFHVFSVPATTFLAYVIRCILGSLSFSPDASWIA